MASYKIVIAAQSDDEHHQQKGLYIFGREGGIYNKVNQNVADINVVSSRQEKDRTEVLTPRTITQTSNGLYILTREGIFGYSKDKFSSVDFKNKPSQISADSHLGLEELLQTAGLSLRSARKITQDPALSGSFSTGNGGLFFSLFATDTLRSKPQEGFLLYSTNGTLDKKSLEIVSTDNGASRFIGEVVSIGPSRALVTMAEPTKGVYVWQKKDSPEKDVFWKESCVHSLQQKIENVLSISYLDLQGKRKLLYNGQSVQGIAALTDNKGGYILFDSRTIDNPFIGKSEYKLADPIHLFAEESGRFLPSEAISSALFQYKDTLYALFGCDDGKLVVMGIEITDQGPKAHHHKTISLVSLERMALYDGKDYHIRNLKVVHGGTPWVRFTMANLYAEMGVSTLLDTDFTPMIAAQEEKNPGEKEYHHYLKKLKEHFSLQQLCSVPHRINGFEEVGPF